MLMLSDDSIEEQDDGEESAHLQDELLSFRRKWQKEVNENKNKNLASNNTNYALTKGIKETKNVEPTKEDKAAKLFVQGAKQEREGNLNAAVHFYRQAVHLVPDIEFKIAENQVVSYMLSDEDDHSDDDDDNNDKTMTTSVELNSLSKSFSLLQVTGLCEVMNPQDETTHISALPTELLMVIVKWIVSKDLDIKSLENLALVCKWFYSCARDPELWRLICIRVWGIHCASVNLYNNCWRTMFINKPRVKYNGVYISTNSYVRIGEQGVDSFYKPCHYVEYYKFLRFFPDGSVLIFTSADEPYEVIQMLQRAPYRDPTIYKGYYRLTDDDVVNIFFKRINKQTEDGGRRRRGRRDVVEIKEQQFFMQLLLKNSKRKKNNLLTLNGYTYKIVNRKTGHTSESDIDVATFNPYFFSPVRSYQALSNTTL